MGKGKFRDEIINGEIKYVNNEKCYGYVRLVNDDLEREIYFNGTCTELEIFEDLRIGDIVEVIVFRGGKKQYKNIYGKVVGVIQKAPKYRIYAKNN